MAQAKPKRLSMQPKLKTPTRRSVRPRHHLQARARERHTHAQARSKRLPKQPTPHTTAEGKGLSYEDTKIYRHNVGELMWLANMTRPDLAYAAGLLARHLQVPTSAQQTHLHNTLAYLKCDQGLRPDSRTTARQPCPCLHRLG